MAPNPGLELALVKQKSPKHRTGLLRVTRTYEIASSRPNACKETVIKISERISPRNHVGKFAQTEARIEFGRGSECPVSYNVTKGQSEDIDRYHSRNEFLRTEAKADCSPKLKQMVASSELFGEVASLMRRTRRL